MIMFGGIFANAAVDCNVYPTNSSHVVAAAWHNVCAPQFLEGEQGIQGIQGIQGVQGETGLTGATGSTGDRGDIGATGQTGATGLTGDTGATGQTGANGTNGKDGSDGSNGVDGVDGTNGTNGLDGSNGDDGEKGDSGTDGSDGASGMDGMDSVDGVDGMDGLDGLDGVDGDNANIDSFISEYNTRLQEVEEYAVDSAAGGVAMSAIDFGTTYQGKTEIGIGIGYSSSDFANGSAGAIGIKHGFTDETAGIVKGWASNRDNFGVGAAVTYTF